MATKDNNRVLHSFWLVQRLELAQRQDAVGLSRHFNREYMGSTEFEVGKGKESLQRIRAQEFVMLPHEISYQGLNRLVYFVGPAEGMEVRVADFQSWLSSGMRSKEWTNFGELFTGKSPFGDLSHIDTIAWWSLEDDILWTLDYNTGELLLKGLASGK